MNYARQECMIQSQLKHENIVELYDYCENEKEIVLLLEYCNNANYFEDKIENVSMISRTFPTQRAIEVLLQNWLNLR